MKNPKVFLDADIIHKLLLRTLLMSLDRAQLLRIRWSDEVLKEAARSIGRRYPARAGLLEKKLVEYSKSFRGSRVTKFEHLIGTLGCPDENDEHVFAAAIVSGSEYLLTFNLKDFPADACERYGVKVIHPDSFLRVLRESEPQVFAQTVDRWLSYFENPELSYSEAARAMKTAGCPKLSAWLESKWEQG